MLEAGLENLGAGAEEIQKSFVRCKSNIGNTYLSVETEVVATKPTAAVTHNEQILSSW